jgi:hypothetical protein
MLKRAVSDLEESERAWCRFEKHILFELHIQTEQSATYNREQFFAIRKSSSEAVDAGAACGVEREGQL